MIQLDTKCTYKVTLRRVRSTFVVAEMQISITYSECVFVALGIQRAMRMRRAILSSVACTTPQYFFFHIIS
jgi:hypothetical protein